MPRQWPMVIKPPIHQETKKNQILRKAGKALLSYIEENSIYNPSCGDDDDFNSLYRSDEFEVVIDKLREALE